MGPATANSVVCFAVLLSVASALSTCPTDSESRICSSHGTWCVGRLQCSMWLFFFPNPIQIVVRSSPFCFVLAFVFIFAVAAIPRAPASADGTTLPTVRNELAQVAPHGSTKRLPTTLRMRLPNAPTQAFVTDRLASANALMDLLATPASGLLVIAAAMAIASPSPTLPTHMPASLTRIGKGRCYRCATVTTVTPATTAHSECVPR